MANSDIELNIYAEIEVIVNFLNQASEWAKTKGRRRRW